ncbi:MAG: hypothetical protein JETCAE02_06460 [Anaerolineaceae bacterium]|nr:MAG: hypothetical protein JETCAE02_06460 [Anaerolineaceae bacterium]
MEFLVCKKQEGEGCDYTIGCGMHFGFVEAASLQDAIERTVYPYGRDKYCALEGENALEKILIISAEHVTAVDVVGMAKEIKQQRAQEAAEAQKEKELAEFKRLQAKYGG